MFGRKKEDTLDLSFRRNPYKKGDIIITLNGESKVIKVYDDVWWRKILRRFKLIELKNSVKVKIIRHEK